LVSIKGANLSGWTAVQPAWCTLTFDFSGRYKIMRADKRWKYIFYLLRNYLLPLIKAGINEGPLKVGDDIVYVLVAGRLRTNVLPTFEELVSKIKREVRGDCDRI
jgi:hypothetical protein